jgi:hypothetical protein
MASSSSCGWCLTVPSLYRIGNHAEAEEHRQWHEEPAGGTRGGGGGVQRVQTSSTFNLQHAMRALQRSVQLLHCSINCAEKGRECVFVRKMRSYQSGQRGAEIAR